MNRPSSVTSPNIALKVDIAKSYRRLKRLRRMVKLAESLNGEINGHETRQALLMISHERRKRNRKRIDCIPH